jgi:glycosyltransferase involved in cell wall biosynthesis/predicted O-methyltransferase YrrM
MLSIIIPALNEIYLQKTIDDLLEKATGKVEVIVVLDGYWPNPPLKDDKRVRIIHHSKSKGMRYSINSAASVAGGEYLLKCDAHCSFKPGYDALLIQLCKPDWTLVPVRYSLDVDKWEPKWDKKYEFEYIASDDLKGKRWPGYADRVKGQNLPDLMTFQGSCWFMHRDRFFELGGLDEVNHGGMGREAQEVCLKSWLSGGSVKLVRTTWYAHWSKSKKDIRFSRREEKAKSVEYAKKIWLNDAWPGQKRKLSWLIDHFSPVPTWKSEKAEIPMTEETIKNGLIIKKGMTRAGLYRHFASLGFSNGAEIGVQRGRNALVMLENIPDMEKLILVDPYEDHPSNPRKWGSDVHEKFIRQAKERFIGTPYENKVRWIITYSEIASYEILDNSLDFVYIDGEHTYDFVMIDLISWTRKVRPGGIVSGHDFEYKGSGRIKKDPKVAHALLDFARAYPKLVGQIYLTDKKAKGEHPGDGSASWFFVKGTR